MRKVLIVIVAVSSLPLVTPAFALQLDDTMNAWKRASDSERSAVLKQLFGDAEKAGLRKCMDETSRTPGHAELAIAEVAKVCASAGKAEQPV